MQFGKLNNLYWIIKPFAIKSVKKPMKYKKRHIKQNKKPTEIVPKLDKQLKDNPFTVPDYFFEDQQRQIFEKTLRTSSRGTRSRQQVLFRKPIFLWPVAGMAALILLFIAVYYTEDQRTTKDYFSGITMEQVLEESPTDLYMLDEDSFYDALSLSSSDWEPSSQLFDLYLDTTISGESIQEYLIEKDLSIDMLNL